METKYIIENIAIYKSNKAVFKKYENVVSQSNPNNDVVRLCADGEIIKENL